MKNSWSSGIKDPLNKETYLRKMYEIWSVFQTTDGVGNAWKGRGSSGSARDSELSDSRLYLRLITSIYLRGLITALATWRSPGRNRGKPERMRFHIIGITPEARP